MGEINWELFKQLVETPTLSDKKRKYIKPEMKTKIRERDVVCKVCGRENKNTTYGNTNLHLHHIDPKGESTEDNLVLICKHCHQAVHSLLFASGRGRYVNLLRL